MEQKQAKQPIPKNGEDYSACITGELTDYMIKNGEKTLLTKEHNQICINCHYLIAALIAGKVSSSDPNKTTAYRYQDGTTISNVSSNDDLYFAVGIGTDATASSQYTLVNEIYRKKVDTVTLDGDTVKLTAEFGSAIGNNLNWTECAIFKGGDGTANSGFMLNRKIHVAIAKTDEITLIRTFTFKF